MDVDSSWDELRCQLDYWSFLLREGVYETGNELLRIWELLKFPLPVLEVDRDGRLVAVWSGGGYAFDLTIDKNGVDGVQFYRWEEVE